MKKFISLIIGIILLLTTALVAGSNESGGKMAGIGNSKDAVIDSTDEFLNVLDSVIKLGDIFDENAANQNYVSSSAEQFLLSADQSDPVFAKHALEQDGEEQPIHFTSMKITERFESDSTVNQSGQNSGRSRIVESGCIEYYFTPDAVVMEMKDVDVFIVTEGSGQTQSGSMKYSATLYISKEDILINYHEYTSSVGVNYTPIIDKWINFNDFGASDAKNLISVYGNQFIKKTITYYRDYFKEFKDENFTVSGNKYSLKNSCVSDFIKRQPVDMSGEYDMGLVTLIALNESQVKDLRMSFVIDLDQRTKPMIMMSDSGHINMDYGDSAIEGSFNEYADLTFEHINNIVVYEKPSNVYRLYDLIQDLDQ